MNRFRSHLDALTLVIRLRLRCGQRHEQSERMLSRRNRVAVGAFITTMPRAVAAGTSILSTPTPARPITRRFLAASITSAVTLVSLRTTKPSQIGYELRTILQLVV
jgi:hypothetical protein